MRHLLLALLLCACASYTKGNETLDVDSGPIGSNPGSPTDGGDGGIDGGPDGGDGGQDAGCTALSLATTSIYDGCVTLNSGVGSVSVDGTNCIANVSIFTVNCRGTVTGPQNAFDGGCNAYSPCTSTSLPGTIVCVNGILSCQIIVDGGP